MYFYHSDEDAFKRYICDNLQDWKWTGHWAAVSFTLRQGRLEHGNFERLTRYEVKKCIAAFLKELNLEASGPAYRRFGKKLAVVPVVELKNGRLHVHMLLERPTRMGFANFADLAISKWTNLQWSLSENEIKPLVTFPDIRNWVTYILKDTDSDDDVLDIHNLFLPWERDENDKKRKRRTRNEYGVLVPLPTIPKGPDRPTGYNLSDFYTFGDSEEQVTTVD